MIAIDPSVLIPWLTGSVYPETERLSGLLAVNLAALTPVTITELLSDVRGAASAASFIDNLSVLDITPGYWLRAGLLRAEVRRRGRRSSMADTLIAQACIDADVALLTRDADFAVFVEVGGLRLA